MILDRFDHYITNPLRNCVNYGWANNDLFHTAVTDSAQIMSLIRNFCEGHSLALSGGSEWLSQADDQTKADAVRLVGAILDQLTWYGK